MEVWGFDFGVNLKGLLEGLYSIITFVFRLF